jgi:hypothetical protein
MGRVVIVISGFTQKNHENTGSKQLWRKLRIERDLCDARDTLVYLREWNTDWKAFAKEINLEDPTEVLVCAYSWGGGFGMPQLCKRLVGTPVTCVLCDPVYRSKTLVGRWAAFCDWKINVPTNVDVVAHFVQKAKWWELDGDPLKGGKSLCDTTTLDYTHTEMDNSHQYHEAAVTVAKKFLGK